MFEVKGTVGCCQAQEFWPKSISISVIHKAMKNTDPRFQGIIITKNSEVAALGKQTTPSPSHPLCTERCACSATFTAHMESLFFTAGQLFPVSFMKSYSILKTTRRCRSRALEPCTGTAAESSGSQFISVCRGGAERFVFLT